MLSEALEQSKKRRQIKTLEAMVTSVVRETPDTTTLFLFTGNERLDYEAGHFLTIDPHQFDCLGRFTAFLEDLKGRREPPRAYSMSSAPSERYLAITVKEERYISGVTKYPPLLSPLLVYSTPVGTRLLITGFSGPYTLSPEIVSRSDNLAHICAGSGSVPNFSILKYALEFHPRLHHTFIYSNRTWNDVIFRKQLEELSKRYADRLTVIHTLTREQDVSRLGPNVRSGRVSRQLLQEVLPELSRTHFYVCGPAISSWERAAARSQGIEPEPRFMESVLGYLQALGVPRQQISRESYG